MKHWCERCDAHIRKVTKEVHVLERFTPANWAYKWKTYTKKYCLACAEDIDWMAEVIINANGNTTSTKVSKGGGVS